MQSLNGITFNQIINLAVIRLTAVTSGFYVIVKAPPCMCAENTIQGGMMRS